MPSLVEQIEQFLRDFGDQTLCDGNKVRDCLLDLRQQALREENTQEEDATPVLVKTF